MYPIEEKVELQKPLESIFSEPYNHKVSENHEFVFEFTLNSPHAAQVAVAGSFNDWKPILLLEKD